MATWQPKVGAPNERVEGNDELEQSLMTVLKTPLDSVPGRRNFGSKLHRIVDMPAQDARPAAISEVKRCVLACEPRVKVIDVEAGPSPIVTAKLRVGIRWIPTTPDDPTRVSRARTLELDF